MAHDHDHDHGHSHAHDHDEGPAVTTALEELGPCRKLLKVEVDPSEIKKEIDSRLRQLRGRVHLKGFRPGKAPRARVEKLYGESVREDVRDHLIRQGYMKALRESLGEAQLLGEGTIENVAFSDGELKFEVTLRTRPEFELGEYKDLEVRISPIQVTDEHLERALEDFRRQRGEMQEVEGAEVVVEGEDQVTLDLDVWLADEYETFSQAAEEAGEDEEGEQTALKPLKKEEDVQVRLPLDYLGGYEVEDLADSLAGLKIGEWGEIETELPADFEVVEGRGEPAMLHAQVKSIRRLILPELTEEWVKEAGHDSIADLKRELREGLQQQLELLRRHEVEEKVLGVLRAQIGDFDLPADIIEREVESTERRRTFELQYREGKSETEAQDMVRQEAESIRADVERGLRNFFILEELSRAEDLSVSDFDVHQRVSQLAASRGANPHEMREELERHDMIPQIRHDILAERARSFLREHANIVEDEDV